MMLWMMGSQQMQDDKERSNPILVVAPDVGVAKAWEEALWKFTAGVQYVVIEKPGVMLTLYTTLFRY